MRVLFCLLGILVGCAQQPSNGALQVYGAASLREVLEGPVPGCTGARRVSTAGSNLVAQQLLAGAPADVFVSAGAEEMQSLVAAGLVRTDDVRSVLSNQLVVIVPAGEAPGSGAWGGLAEAKRISMAHPEAVPAGRYGKLWLESIGLWEELEERMVFAVDVRAAAAAVATGAVDYGVVYRSDALQIAGVEVTEAVTSGPLVTYFAAPLSQALNSVEAAAFVDGLGSQSSTWTAFLNARGFAAQERLP